MGKTVTLTVGDWSADGHGRTHHVMIRTNLSAPELKAAYKHGSDILGFDFQESVACDYQDGTFPEDVFDKLVKVGLPVDDIFGDGYTPDDGLDYDTYWMVWLFIAKVGDERLVYKQVLEGSNINVGGYGLFW